MVNIQSVDSEIEQIEKEVEEAKKRLIEARKRRPQEAVEDYELTDWEGRQVCLSEIFGDKEDLVVVHNMGTGCVYCTLWADGFTGFTKHLADRAAFIVVSPDAPEIQKRFAEKRGWNFRMLSAHQSRFNKDLGFHTEEGGPWPGVSTFKKLPDGSVVRVAKTYFQPGDDFCSVWPVLDMLDGGAKGWEPQYTY